MFACNHRSHRRDIQNIHAALALDKDVCWWNAITYLYVFIKWNTHTHCININVQYLYFGCVLLVSIENTSWSCVCTYTHTRTHGHSEWKWIWRICCTHKHLRIKQTEKNHEGWFSQVRIETDVCSGRKIYIEMCTTYYTILDGVFSHFFPSIFLNLDWKWWFQFCCINIYNNNKTQNLYGNVCWFNIHQPIGHTNIVIIIIRIMLVRQ